MEYELSEHARDVMAEREITDEWVDRVLKNPAKVEPWSTALGGFPSTGIASCVLY